MVLVLYITLVNPLGALLLKYSHSCNPLLFFFKLYFLNVSLFDLICAYLIEDEVLQFYSLFKPQLSICSLKSPTKLNSFPLFIISF